MTDGLEETPLDARRGPVERGPRSVGDRDSRAGGVMGYGGDSSARRATEVVEAVRSLAAPLAELAATADTLPQEYKAAAFAEFVRFLLATDALLAQGLRVAPIAEMSHTIGRLTEPLAKSENAPALESATSSVERALALPQRALLRVLQIDGDKNVQVLTRVEGRSISERQIRLAQIVCYVREKGLGEMKTDIETLRAACINQGLYDPANFAANFRRDGTILEAPNPGSKERLFILSREGVESAAALLRQLAGN